MLAGGARRWELRAGLMDGSMAAPGRGVAYTPDIPLSKDIWWEWPGSNRLLHRGSRSGQRSMVSLPRHTSSCNSAPGGPHSHMSHCLHLTFDIVKPPVF